MALKSIEQLKSDILALSVIEAAELAGMLEKELGISASMMAGSAGSSQQEAPKAAEEKSEYKVELIESGADKMKVIKALRQVKKELGLMEAKNAVENVPFVIADAASVEESKTIKETLEAAGAKVKLS